MKCTICGYDPCLCDIRAAIASEASFKVTTTDEMIERMRSWVPSGFSFGDEPPPPELMLKVLSHPRSPFKLSDDALIGFTRRLYELAQDAPSSPPSIEQVWNAIAMDLTVASQRLGEALVYLVEMANELIEDHPLVKDHRAYIIDQVIRILAGDRYAALRVAAFGPDYNQGVKLEIAEPTEPS